MVIRLTESYNVMLRVLSTGVFTWLQFKKTWSESNFVFIRCLSNVFYWFLQEECWAGRGAYQAYRVPVQPEDTFLGKSRHSKCHKSPRRKNKTFPKYYLCRETNSRLSVSVISPALAQEAFICQECDDCQVDNPNLSIKLCRGRNGSISRREQNT